jgi:ABC-type transport system involved in multi-copper enzyme maturation permease subunit
MLRINPVYLRELKQTARMKKIIVLLLIFNSLLALFGLFSFYLTFEGAKQAEKVINYADMLKIYTIISGIEFVLLIFITPGITAGAIAGEREKQTLDILLSTTMTPAQIIRGKLFASINLLLMLAFSSLPVMAIVFSIGGITFYELFELMLLLLITAIFIGSIGIFFSAMCKRSTIATVCTYTAVLLITAGLTMILLGNQLMGSLFETKNVYRVQSAQQIEVNESMFLLLLNPVFSFAAMIKNQIGMTITTFGTWKTKHHFAYYIFQHWFYISLGVQLVVSMFLIWIAGKKIAPSRAHRKHNI